MLQGHNEFVVHIMREYDYRFVSDYRKEIFDAIKYVWWRDNKKNLPVYGVPQKLKEFHTSKKDIAKNCEIRPPDSYRLADEDIFPEGDQIQPKPIPMGVTAEDQNFGDEAAKSVFQRNKNEVVNLNDFTIKSVIGRGSFGKVFLVQKVQDKKVYAMKSLRKDTILDYE